jgi:hypothetical protein
MDEATFMEIRKNGEKMKACWSCSIPPKPSSKNHTLVFLYQGNIKVSMLTVSFTNSFLSAIMKVALFCGLGRAPTFLVPIINPPFADTSPHPTPEEARNDGEKKTRRSIPADLQPVGIPMPKFPQSRFSNGHGGCCPPS